MLVERYCTSILRVRSSEQGLTRLVSSFHYRLSTDLFFAFGKRFRPFLLRLCASGRLLDLHSSCQHWYQLSM